MHNPSRWTPPASVLTTGLIGALAGGAFFFWIAGPRTIDPTEVAWTMQLDWRIHFLGWHFFRGEPWHWPPGLIEGYSAPSGTAIGFTDSIPLMALLLKPIAAWLPMPFQYLGLWLLTCFVLQGVFGVLLIRRWTSDVRLQLVGAGFFILMPTLLIRVGHPSLCSHWLLLWGLRLYFAGPATRARSLGADHSPLADRLGQHVALGLCAGLIHPYLAVMTLTILAARAMVSRNGLPFIAALLAVILGWWAAGLFSVTGPDNLASEGIGNYAMNMLAPFGPTFPGWSRFLPLVPIAMPGQAYEGFQYFGLGVLVMFGLAFAVLIRHHSPAPSWQRWLPLVAVATACAVYALSPLITIGTSVLVDARSASVDRLAVFRGTGRFFWPLAYVMLTAAIGIVITRLAPRVALAVLTPCLVLQFIDLGAAHAERRTASRSDAFHGWSNPLSNPAWHHALPHYRHLVLVPPRQCGSAVLGFEGPAFLAGLYGVTINSAEVARFDEARRRQYCEQLTASLNAGQFADDTLYLMGRALADRLKPLATTPVVCGQMDQVWACATRRSYEAWQSSGVLQSP